MPRALNVPVGFVPSSFTYSSRIPTVRSRLGHRRRGEPPSPSGRTCSRLPSGRTGRYRHRSLRGSRSSRRRPSRAERGEGGLLVGRKTPKKQGLILKAPPGGGPPGRPRALGPRVGRLLDCPFGVRGSVVDPQIVPGERGEIRPEAIEEVDADGPSGPA